MTMAAAGHSAAPRPVAFHPGGRPAPGRPGRPNRPRAGREEGPEEVTRLSVFCVLLHRHFIFDRFFDLGYDNGG